MTKKECKILKTSTLQEEMTLKAKKKKKLDEKVKFNDFNEKS